MEKVQKYLEGVYENRICDEYDHILPVVGDEGAGKSTFILQTIALYRDIRGLDPTDQEAILRPLAYSREGVKDKLANAEKRSIIAVPDAGRVLHKKETMKGEQVELEKDFFDVRTKEFLILLGFQSWGMIPSFLQERRAKNLFYLPKRGLVRGYNRESLNQKQEMDDDKWPRADLSTTFPSLDGTDLWERYKEVDRTRKEQRMAGNETGDRDDEETTPQDVVTEIKTSGTVGYFVRKLNNGQTIVDTDLIQHDYPELSVAKSEQVKKVLERDVDLEGVAGSEGSPTADGGGGISP